MKNPTTALLAAAAVAVAALSFAGGSAMADHHEDKSDKMAKQKDIIGTAKAAGQFKTLAKALKEAELVKTLKGEGPFTVFAPTDDAFAALPSGTLDTLLMEENKDQLRGILTYHVASGELMAADVVEKDEIETVQGEAVRVSIVDDKVMLNDTVQVIKTDVDASNGVIHVINGVLIPVGGDAAEEELEDAAEDMGM
jgi:uncharacterized surface protein with fasciclin (FAS1) repeats